MTTFLISSILWCAGRREPDSHCRRSLASGYVELRQFYTNILAVVDSVHDSLHFPIIIIIIINVVNQQIYEQFNCSTPEAWPPIATCLLHVCRMNHWLGCLRLRLISSNCSMKFRVIYVTTSEICCIQSWATTNYALIDQKNDLNCGIYWRYAISFSIQTTSVPFLRSAQGINHSGAAAIWMGQHRRIVYNMIWLSYCGRWMIAICMRSMTVTF